MRTTPLSHWRSIAISFDSSIRRAFESIVGCPLPPSAYTQASLTPVWHEVASCPCCTHTLDIFGVHALCCTTSGDLIARHNRIRDLVDKIAREGHLGPVLEKKGILGETSGRRPGDVTIPLWCEGKG